MQHLLKRAQPEIPHVEKDSTLLAYAALLTRVLEDRQVDEQEGQALAELAAQWAIPADKLQEANWDYLLRLGIAALADGVMTEAERRDLEHVASLLEIDARSLTEILNLAEKELAEIRNQPSTTAGSLMDEELRGKKVCFTGESRCWHNGELITREKAAQLTERRGLVFANSVTKNLDLLVVSDCWTQSGKAQKARRYGIRLVPELVFWNALGLKVEEDGETLVSLH